jgi:hypothetical protein
VFRALALGVSLGVAGCVAPEPHPTADLTGEPPPMVSAPLPPAAAAESAPILDAGPDNGDAGDAALEPTVAEPMPRQPFHEPMPDPALAAGTPALSFANLTGARCRAELKKKQIETKAPKAAPKTILVPLRLAGPLHGVRFITAPAPSPYGIVDCRLVLALDELASVLSTFDVVTIRIDNLYRPRAKLPGSHKRSQHAYGLAADITSFTLADGRTLSVEDDWHATIGEKACGPDAVMSDPDDESIALRNIVCEIARRGLFHHLLTPGFNAAHRTHFHFDIQRNEKRWAIH